MTEYRIEMDFFINDNGTIWFVDRLTRGLFRVNVCDKVMHLVSFIPDSGYRMYNSGIKKDDKLVFFPYSANNILIYDIRKNIFNKLQNDCIQSCKAQYSIAICYGNNAIAISTYGEPSILILDLENYSINKVKLSIPQNSTIGRDYEVRDGKLYLTLIDLSMIIEVDLTSFTSTIHEIKNNDEGFGTICCVEKRLLLTGTNGIYMWNIDEDKVDIVLKYPSYLGVYDKSGKYSSGFNRKEVNYKQPFWRSYVVGSKVIIISSVVSRSLIFDWGDKDLYAIDLGDSENVDTIKKYPLKKRTSIIKHIATLQAGDTIVYSNTRDNSIIKYNCLTDTLEELVKEFPIEDRMKLINGNVTDEGSLLSLKEWINITIIQD